MNYCFYVLTIIFPLVAGAQLTFEKSYGTPGNEFATDMLVLDDYIYISSVNYNGSNPDSCFYIVKTDQSGNIIWLKKFCTGYSFGGVYGRISKYSNGSIMIAYNSPDLIRVNLDSSGNILSAKSYALPAGSFYPQLDNECNNGNLLYGKIDLANSRNGLVMKLDSFGNFQWCMSYFIDSLSECYLTSSVNLSDGSFLLGGYIRNDPVLSHFEFFVMKTDSNGNVIRAYRTDNSIAWMSPTFGPAAMRPIGNNYFVSSNYDMFFAYDSTGLLLRRMHVDVPIDEFLISNNTNIIYYSMFEGGSRFVNIDSTFVPVSVKFFPDLIMMEIFLLDTLSNGNFISAGSRKGVDSTDIFLIRADSNNNGICIGYPSTINHWLDSVMNIPVLMQSMPQIPVIQTITPQVTTITLTETTYCLNATEFLINEAYNEGVNISPNPFSVSTNVQILNSISPYFEAGLRIFDTMGKLVQMETLCFKNGSATFVKKNLISGMYFFELHADSQTNSITGKFVIE